MVPPFLLTQRYRSVMAPASRMTKQELRPTLVRLPPDLHEAIKAKAAAEERSMAQAIRHALRIYTQSAEATT